jgi:hypothetical protein
MRNVCFAAAELQEATPDTDARGYAAIRRRETAPTTRRDRPQAAFAEKYCSIPRDWYNSPYCPREGFLRIGPARQPRLLHLGWYVRLCIRETRWHSSKSFAASSRHGRGGMRRVYSFGYGRSSAHCCVCAYDTGEKC